jgi:hypothetical protein
LKGENNNNNNNNNLYFLKLLHFSFRKQRQTRHYDN